MSSNRPPELAVSPTEILEVIEVEDEVAMERRPTVPPVEALTTPPAAEVPVQSPTPTLVTALTTIGLEVKQVSIMVPMNSSVIQDHELVT